jgi:hypothetical protein
VCVSGVKGTRREEGLMRARRCDRYFGNLACFFTYTYFRETLGIAIVSTYGLKTEVQIDRAGYFDLIVGRRI